MLPFQMCTGIVCDPSSGSFFPQGGTTVMCTSDTGNVCSFTIMVNNLAPIIACPPNQAIPASDGTAVVNYPPPSASDNCSVMSILCTPPSGSTLPAGDTVATCTATDTDGGAATCSFLIKVFRPVPVLGAVGLGILVLIVGSIGVWMLYRRRATA